MSRLISLIRRTLLPLAALVCGSEACAQAQDAQAFPSAEARRAGAWAVREVARSRDDSLFSDITGMDVDSRGRIYVADWFAARVAVLDSTGALLRTIGRKGLGPGEFRSLRGVQLLPGDTLLAYDPAAARISIFPPDSSGAARVVSLAAGLEGGAPFLVRRTAGDGYLAFFRPPFAMGDTAVRLDRVRLLNPDGSPRGEPLRSFPSQSFLLVRASGGFSVTPNPFGREGLFAAGAGGVLHLAWSDSLAVETVDADGRRLAAFAVPYRAPEVTSGDVEAAMAGIPTQAARTFRPALQDSLPGRWPALRALVADAEGTAVWLGLNTPAGEAGEWASFQPDGRYLGSVFLPREVMVMAVRGRRLYGVRRDVDGVPEILVYQTSAQAAGGNG
jgi:hypothetical protein